MKRPIVLIAVFVCIIAILAGCGWGIQKRFKDVDKVATDKEIFRYKEK
jgi:hypothetical protein